MSSEELDEDDEDYESKPYVFNGQTYLMMWDDDEKCWIITDPVSCQMIGYPNDAGGIDFSD